MSGELTRVDRLLAAPPPPGLEVRVHPGGDDGGWTEIRRRRSVAERVLFVSSTLMLIGTLRWWGLVVACVVAIPLVRNRRTERVLSIRPDQLRLASGTCIPAEEILEITFLGTFYPEVRIRTARRTHRIGAKPSHAEYLHALLRRTYGKPPHR